jgi:hypothetical protein
MTLMYLFQGAQSRLGEGERKVRLSQDSLPNIAETSGKIAETSGK